MSETDNTQNTDPATTTDDSSSTNTNVVTTEQLFSMINSLLSNLQGYATAMNNEATFVYDSLASTDYNPTIVDDVVAQIETHKPVIEMLKSAFSTDMASYNAASETFSVTSDKDMFESEDARAMRESIAIQTEVEFNNSASLIEFSINSLEERKVPEDMKEEFNAAIAGVVEVGNPLAEMYMGTLFVISSLASVYNTCYRTPIDEELAMQGQAAPLTRDQLVATVAGVNDFLSNVFTALTEKDEIYANCIDYINALPETIRNHYYLKSIVGQIDMILGMVNSNEASIKTFSTAINEGVPSQGPKGDTGSKGDKGDKGDVGPAGTLTLDYLKLGFIFGGGAVVGAIITALMMFFI